MTMSSNADDAAEACFVKAARCVDDPAAAARGYAEAAEMFEAGGNPKRAATMRGLVESYTALAASRVVRPLPTGEVVMIGRLGLDDEEHARTGLPDLAADEVFVVLVMKVDAAREAASLLSRPVTLVAEVEL